MFKNKFAGFRRVFSLVEKGSLTNINSFRIDARWIRIWKFSATRTCRTLGKIQWVASLAIASCRYI